MDVWRCHRWYVGDKIPLMRKLITVVFLATACNSAPQGASDHFYLDKQATEHAAEWSYEGETGPDHWGDLSPQYRLATTGKMQSPINIDTHTVKIEDLPELELHYGGETPDFVNNGHTIQHNQENDGSELIVGGKHYRLEQFHLHAPSEHTIDGRLLPLEIHVVHKAADGEIAVIAVFVEEGKSSAALKLIADAQIPDHKGDTGSLKQPILMRHLLPVEPHYYTYRGSFTTPPCTEGVRWFVLKHRLEATGPLLRKMADALKNNHRPVQALNGRVVRGH